MAKDVVIGDDGASRCVWAGAADSPLRRYHDEVWGTPTLQKPALFEALTLGVFQAGLSWSVVFGKRDGFRHAFHDFRATKVAAMTESDVRRLVADSSIIRNRAKIVATIDNARAFESSKPTLGELTQRFTATRSRPPKSLAAIPTSTAQAAEFAQALKAQGYRFVGPTGVYAFMQNVGAVNDHLLGCFRAAGITRPEDAS